jgi:hypothetical protein
MPQAPRPDRGQGICLIVGQGYLQYGSRILVRDETLPGRAVLA